jgi:hypothetical protein
MPAMASTTCSTPHGSFLSFTIASSPGVYFSALTAVGRVRTCLKLACVGLMPHLDGRFSKRESIQAQADCLPGRIRFSDDSVERNAPHNFNILVGSQGAAVDSNV